MQQYKIIIDTLTSSAALVAIIGVLVSWFRSLQKPLNIERVVIHKEEEGSTFILIVRNRKEFPVNINSISCYKKPTYEVQKKNNQKPEYLKYFSSSDLFFRNSDQFVIDANGHTEIRIKSGKFNGPVQRLLFSINTSHGYHEIWCKDILEVDIGKSEVFGVEYKQKYKSKYIAKTVHYWKSFLDSSK